MKDKIKAYSLAVEEAIEASRAEIISKIQAEKARYALIQARDDMRAEERALLSELI